MNHYPKFSLILLIPFSIIASSPENKPSKKITFFHNKNTNANAKNTSISATTNTNTINTITENTEVTSTTSNPKAAQTLTTSNNTSIDNLVVDSPRAQEEEEEVITLQNGLGLPYSIGFAPEQTAEYVAGKDGIAKFLKLETSSTYIDRLLATGKFAGAASNNKDSFLSDHLRRTIECKQEELAKKSASDKNAILELLKKQREATTKQFSGTSVLLDATKKHASRDVTLSTIEAFLQQIKSIQESKKILAITIAQEFEAQNAFLYNLFNQLDNLKKAQSSQIDK